MAHKKNRRMRPSWEVMLIEEGVRQRIGRESPEALKLLDYLKTRVRPYDDGYGWTVFNDWLDACYFKRYVDKRPSDVPYVDLDEMRQIVFPECRDCSSV